MTAYRRRGPTRRDTLAGAAAVAMTPLLGAPSWAAPEDMEREVKNLVGSAAVKVGRVKVEMPELTENGNSTSLTITVDSPMTAGDHVRAIHLFSEKNPVAYIVRIGIGPRAGRAKSSLSSASRRRAASRPGRSSTSTAATISRPASPPLRVSRTCWPTC